MQRDITAGTAPHHKFSQVSSGGPPDQRVAFQHIDCPDYVVETRGHVRRVMLKEMFQDAIEIVAHLEDELDA